MAERGATRTRWAALLLVALAPGLSSCSLLGDDGDDDTSTSSVFDVGPGTCLQGPTELEADITELETVPCGRGHTLEAYALVAYEPGTGEDGASGEEGGDGDEAPFPGEQSLTEYADGVCAQEFQTYVGTSYLDSALFFTYLLPTPRSWEEGDRDVLCVVTAAGETLTGSVKDSAR